MRPPIHRLKKTEIVWLTNHTCEAHRKSYLEHYNCYVKEQPNKERTCVLDLETSNLKADYGIVLTWCIKPLDSEKIEFDVITVADIKKGRNGDEDRRVVQSCIKAMSNYDKVIGYYSKRFDLPFLRTRALNMGLDFPFFGSIAHIDVYDIIKTRFNLSRKTQENACRNLLGETEKNHVKGNIWRDAARGDKKALGYVLEHNKRDVRDLQKLYLKVRDFSRRNDTSI